MVSQDTLSICEKHQRKMFIELLIYIKLVLVSLLKSTEGVGNLMSQRWYEIVLVYYP